MWKAKKFFWIVDSRRRRKRGGETRMYDNLCSWNECNSFEAIKKLASNFHGKTFRDSFLLHESHTNANCIISQTRKINSISSSFVSMFLGRVEVWSQVSFVCVDWNQKWPNPSPTPQPTPDRKQLLDSCALIYYANKFQCFCKRHQHYSANNNEKLFWVFPGKASKSDGGGEKERAKFRIVKSKHLTNKSEHASNSFCFVLPNPHALFE